jgi:hypothetical protein
MGFLYNCKSPPPKKILKKYLYLYIYISPTQNERGPVCTQGSKAANQRNCCKYKVETPYHANDLILTPIIYPQSGWQ